MVSRPHGCRTSAPRRKYRLLKRLPKLEDDKRLSGFDADAILWTVMEYTDRVAEGNVVPEDLSEEIAIPGVPKGVGWEEYDGWTAGTVRAGIEAVAKATDEDPAELLEAGTDGARRDIVSKERAAERVKQDLQKISRERLLPDDKTLEKVAR
ncbi:MAG: hypothetical protein LC740_01345 [Actinobacteria bacterium]|nr:hypothetical protein [Actinomycetota bacterium]